MLLPESRRKWEADRVNNEVYRSSKDSQSTTALCFRLNSPAICGYGRSFNEHQNIQTDRPSTLRKQFSTHLWEIPVHNPLYSQERYRLMIIIPATNEDLTGHLRTKCLVIVAWRKINLRSRDSPKTHAWGLQPGISNGWLLCTNGKLDYDMESWFVLMV